MANLVLGNVLSRLVLIHRGILILSEVGGGRVIGLRCSLLDLLVVCHKILDLGQRLLLLLLLLLLLDIVLRALSQILSLRVVSVGWTGGSNLFYYVGQLVSALE